MALVAEAALGRGPGDGLSLLEQTACVADAMGELQCVGRQPGPLALALIVDVCPRAVYELGEYLPLTLELTMHVRARPGQGRLLGRVKTRHLRYGYHDEDLERQAQPRPSIRASHSRQIGSLLSLSTALPCRMSDDSNSFDATRR